MWYHEEQQTRGYEVTFPDGIKITGDDADRSPFRGFVWHDTPPQWWVELQEQSEGVGTPIEDE